MENNYNNLVYSETHAVECTFSLNGAANELWASRSIDLPMPERTGEYYFTLYVRPVWDALKVVSERLYCLTVSVADAVFGRTAGAVSKFARKTRQTYWSAKQQVKKLVPAVPLRLRL